MSDVDETPPASTEEEIRADEREDVLEEVAHEQEEQRQWETLNSLSDRLSQMEQKLDSLATTAPAATEEAAAATATEPVEEVEADLGSPTPPEKKPKKFRIL